MKYAIHTLLVGLLLLSSCTLLDDRSKPSKPTPEGVSYVISSHADNGAVAKEWNVDCYIMGMFPPRVSFLDPVTKKRVTITGSFTIAEITPVKWSRPE